MARKTKKKIPLESGTEGFQNSFADIFAKQGLAPKKDIPKLGKEKEPSTNNDVSSIAWKSCKNVVLRHERRGRGGKTVTLLKGLPFNGCQLLVIAKSMRKAMGCGAGVEEDRIVLQGNQMIKAHKWLLDQGVSTIVFGTRPSEKGR